MKPLEPRRLHRSPRTASDGLHRQKSGRAGRGNLRIVGGMVGEAPGSIRSPPRG
ncbi:MAG: hypothetical protein MPL62_10115 [Alphaproteobacteria bacterium]|nr:hypothetical protein [Alphaproteobacteria bacterium]